MAKKKVAKEDKATLAKEAQTSPKKTDFDTLLQAMKVEDKVIENVYDKFRKVLPEWLAFIDCSFLPQQMKEEYKTLIQERWAILSE